MTCRDNFRSCMHARQKGPNPGSVGGTSWTENISNCFYVCWRVFHSFTLSHPCTSKPSFSTCSENCQCESIWEDTMAVWVCVPFEMFSIGDVSYALLPAFGWRSVGLDNHWSDNGSDGHSQIVVLSGNASIKWLHLKLLSPCSQQKRCIKVRTDVVWPFTEDFTLPQKFEYGNRIKMIAMCLPSHAWEPVAVRCLQKRSTNNLDVLKCHRFQSQISHCCPLFDAVSNEIIPGAFDLSEANGTGSCCQLIEWKTQRCYIRATMGHKLQDIRSFADGLPVVRFSPTGLSGSADYDRLRVCAGGGGSGCAVYDISCTFSGCQTICLQITCRPSQSEWLKV